MVGPSLMMAIFILPCLPVCIKEIRNPQTYVPANLFPIVDDGLIFLLIFLSLLASKKPTKPLEAVKTLID
jgi:hypothetical protein